GVPPRSVPAKKRSRAGAGGGGANRRGGGGDGGGNAAARGFGRGFFSGANPPPGPRGAPATVRVVERREQRALPQHDLPLRRTHRRPDGRIGRHAARVLLVARRGHHVKRLARV